jgi:hypothetical protein
MHEFARRNNLLRNLIPLWMRKYEVGGEFIDEMAEAAGQSRCCLNQPRLG